MDVNNFFNADWGDWIQFNMAQTQKWQELFVIALWHIWKNRNKVVLEGAMSRSSSQFNQFITDYMYNNDVFHKQAKMNHKPHQNIVWKPPVHGYLKLNTDGSWKANDKASGGGVIRNRWFVVYGLLY